MISLQHCRYLRLLSVQGNENAVEQNNRSEERRSAWEAGGHPSATARVYLPRLQGVAHAPCRATVFSPQEHHEPLASLATAHGHREAKRTSKCLSVLFSAGEFEIRARDTDTSGVPFLLSRLLAITKVCPGMQDHIT